MFKFSKILKSVGKLPFGKPFVARSTDNPEVLYQIVQGPDEKTEQPSPQPKYRHYKSATKNYLFLTEAFDEKQKDHYVIYQANYAHKMYGVNSIWARNKDEFYKLKISSTKEKRFTLVID